MEEEHELREEWLRHPWTQAQKRAYEKKRDEAYKSLVTACRNSSDPKVIGAYAHYEQIGVWVKILGGEVFRG